MPTLLERALRATQAPQKNGNATATRQRDAQEQFKRRVDAEQQRLQRTIEAEQRRLRQRAESGRQFREYIGQWFVAAEIPLTYDEHRAVGPYGYVDIAFGATQVRYSIWSLPDLSFIRMQGRSSTQIFPWRDAPVSQAPERFLAAIAEDYRHWAAQSDR